MFLGQGWWGGGLRALFHVGWTRRPADKPYGRTLRPSTRPSLRLASGRCLKTLKDALAYPNRPPTHAYSQSGPWAPGAQICLKDSPQPPLSANGFIPRTRTRPRNWKPILRTQTTFWPLTPCVTFRPSLVSLRGPGQPPVVPYASCRCALLRLCARGVCLPGLWPVWPPLPLGGGPFLPLNDGLAQRHDGLVPRGRPPTVAGTDPFRGKITLLCQ